MQPFSEHYPKPILPVGDRPLLAHQLEILAGLGVRDVVVVIGHLGHEVVRALGDGSRWGVRIEYLEQEQTLGIAHAVSRLEHHVDRPFFLFLGDIYFETGDLGSMLARLESGASGVLAVKREPDVEAIKRNFIVLCGEGERVRRVIEKPRHPQSDLKGCGLYLFTPPFFDAVRRTPRTALRDEYEVTDAIQIFIDDGYRVDAAEVVRVDMNVSYPRDLLELNLRELERRGVDRLVADGARVAPGASLRRTVVMHGASVPGDAVLEECVVFPDTAVAGGRARHRVILTPETEISCDGDG